MRIGFVQCETIEGRFNRWEDSLKWESYLDYYCLALSRLGHECIKYVPSLSILETKEYRHIFGHRVKRIPVNTRHRISKVLMRNRKYHGGYTTTAHYLQGLFFTFNLLREVRNDRIDILHYSSYFSSFFVPSILISIRTPLVTMYTGGALPTSLKQIIWRFFLYLSLRSSSAILVGEIPNQIRMLSSLGDSISRKIKRFTAAIVDLEVFKPYKIEDARKVTGMNSDAKIILSVTFMPSEEGLYLGKDPFLMLKVFSELKKLMTERIELHIVGTGPGERKLRNYIDAFGINDSVVLHGMIDHRMLPYFYSSADIVFIPYRYELMSESTATYEAFACGRPVVGFKRYPYISSRQLGGYLISDSPARGAKELAELISNDKLIHDMSLETIGLASECSLKNAGTKLQQIYFEILDH